MKKRLVKYMMMAMIVFTLAGTRVYAAEPSGGAEQQQDDDDEDDDDDDDDSDGDIEDDPVAPNEGSASIIEHGYGPAPVAGVDPNSTLVNKLDKFYDASKNETEADLTFDNDLPVITMEETFAEKDGYEVDNN